MAVGDAAGLVDPITGEGLYYAMRSGDLASRRCWTTKRLRRKRKPTEPCCGKDFAADLEFGSLLAKRVYSCSFLFSTCRRAWCSSPAAARGFADHAGFIRGHAVVSGTEEPVAAAA
jgi:flavin-dependent dehydrogenase